jgi:hypothetical protein
MQVQTVQQWLALTEENRRQREMHGVDQPLAKLGLYMLGAGAIGPFGYSYQED